MFNLLKPRKLLAELATTLKKFEGGIYKRIDENRELVALLQQEAPELLRDHPEILLWLISQDNFLVAIEKINPPEEAQFRQHPGVFPRPWPARSKTPIPTFEEAKEAWEAIQDDWQFADRETMQRFFFDYKQTTRAQQRNPLPKYRHYQEQTGRWAVGHQNGESLVADAHGLSERHAIRLCALLNKED